MESPAPAPYTTGYKFGNLANSLFNHPLTGQFDPQNLAAYNLGVQNPKPPNAPVSLWRSMAAANMQERVLTNPKVPYYNSHISKETIHFEASQYSLDNNPRQIKMNIHRKKSTKHTGANAPAILYFHGGGVVFYDIEAYQYQMARYADENDVVVFSVDYRLAPETPAPGNIWDCYAGFKHVVENSEKFGIDAGRVGVFGESGGGYLAVGTVMKLIERGEEGMVKLLMAGAPMTGNEWVRLEKSEFGGDVEKTGYEGMRQVCFWLAGKDPEVGMGELLDSPEVFPNLMSDEIAAKFPPSVVFTSEFDYLRVASEELAKKLEKNGKLVDYCDHPGTIHCWWFKFPNQPVSDVYFADQKKVIDKWLL